MKQKTTCNIRLKVAEREIEGREKEKKKKPGKIDG